MKLIDKDALVAEIEKQKQLIFPQNTGEMKVADVPKPLEQGWLNALSWIKKTIDTLEVKEMGVDLGDPKGDKSAKHIIDTKTLEVKEVDFEKELDRIWFDNKLGDYFDNDALDFAHIRTLCKHFYSLGLAQKGE